MGTWGEAGRRRYGVGEVRREWGGAERGEREREKTVLNSENPTIKNSFLLIAT